MKVMLRTLLAFCVAVAVICLLSSCTKTQVRYVTIEKPMRVLNLPAKLHEWSATAGGEGDCPDAWAFCVAPLDWAALELNYRYMFRRIVDDWDLCGVKEP